MSLQGLHSRLIILNLRNFGLQIADFRIKLGFKFVCRLVHLHLRGECLNLLVNLAEPHLQIVCLGLHTHSQFCFAGIGGIVYRLNLNLQVMQFLFGFLVLLTHTFLSFFEHILIHTPLLIKNLLGTRLVISNR